MLRPFMSIFVCSLALLLLQGCAAVFVAGTASTAMMLHDRRDFETQLQDTNLELTLNHTLAKHADLLDPQQARLRIFAMNSKVLLVGQVTSNQLKDKVIQLIRKQKGVVQLYDELSIAAPISFTVRSQDSWLSAKVRTSLIADEKIDFSRIKIVTENQKIYLMGIVTREEADRATELARQTVGVKEVIRVFEFVS